AGVGAGGAAAAVGAAGCRQGPAVRLPWEVAAREPQHDRRQALAGQLDLALGRAELAQIPRPAPGLLPAK
ncbi:MAG: hypothetical protein WCB27_05720, partial [Thermoguttaceae bacterium]